jgi:hypothetical protein
MRKLIIAASGLVVFCTGWCVGQVHHGNDGNSWHKLPPVAHTFYVLGFSHGYASAILHAGALAIAKNAPESVSSMTPAGKKDYDETLQWARRIAPFELHGATRTVGELEGALDTFYNDYRNTPVCLDEAILFSIASLAGNAAPDRELVAARKNGAEGGCE